MSSGFTIGNGLSLIAIVLGIGGVAWTGSGEIRDIRDELATARVQLDDMKLQVARFENLKSDLQSTQQQIFDQQQQIATANQSSIEAVAETKRVQEQISSVTNELSSLKESLPKGVTLPDSQCVKLNRPITMTRDSSVEFCDSNLVVSIGDIRLDGNFVVDAYSSQPVPSIERKNYDPCIVHYLNIDKNNPENLTVNIMGVCTK